MIDVETSESTTLTANLTYISVGKPTFESFTIQVNGYYSQPVAFDASADEVADKVRRLFGPECPDGLGSSVGSNLFKF